MKPVREVFQPSVRLVAHPVGDMKEKKDLFKLSFCYIVTSHSQVS